MRRVEVMKVLSLVIGLLFAAASSAAYAVTIAGYNLASTSDSASVDFGTYYDWTNTVVAYNDVGYTVQQPTSDALNAALTYTDASSVGTYVYSRSNNASLTVSFSNPFYNGDGNDLALFFVGDAVPSVEVAIGNSVQTIGLQGTGQHVTNQQTGISYNLSVGLIDLSGFNVPGYTAVSSFTLITSPITLSYDGVNCTDPLGCHTAAGLSLAGSMYDTQQAPFPSPVPLPLPALLFGSGLGVLGLFGRKRSLKS
jgi:hypothetical protein